MKLALISLLAAAPAFAADAPKAEAPKGTAKVAGKLKVTMPPKEAYKTDDEKTIYTIGFLMGRNMSPFNLTPAEVKIAQAGFADSALNAPPKADVRFYHPRVNDLLTKRMEAANAKITAASEPERAKGRAFTEKWVAENKPVAVPGGGWYLETQAGTGDLPAKTAKIKARYRGTLVDGTQFDAGDYEFSLQGGVIQCWLNVFATMKQGAKGKIVCPSEVAYGNQDKGVIKPGATLLFDIELLEIKP